MPKPKAVPAERPSLAFVLIAKDAAHTLGLCLDSIKPYAQQIVVCVDERTTDKTAQVARRKGAEVYPVKVSDWHECERHGRILAQHFADARDSSFTHIDPAVEWVCWIDSDDILKGGENLYDILNSVPPEVVGVWTPYHYSTMQQGAATNTLFHRERFLRQSVGWKWEYRVHEVVTPQKPGPWLRADQVQIYHQEGAHKTDSSAARNLLLLEIDYESDPNCSRTLFYLGNQYFAMAKWEQAIEWYERLGQLAARTWVNQYELWQSRCYQAMAAQRLQNFNLAQQAAFAAIDAAPNHPEPYYILASMYAQTGQPNKAIYWTQHGRKQEEPPFFVFKNPLDYTFNNRMAMSDSLAQLGRVPEARQELEEAYSSLADPNISSAIEHYRKIEAETAEGQRFKDFAQYLNGSGSVYGDGLVVDKYRLLSRQVKGIQSVRDIAVPIILRNRPNTQPSITFWAPTNLEEWAPPRLTETGLGGSETAVIQIARRFADDAWRVNVYTNAGAYEGTYENVGYWDARRYDFNAPATVGVAWRQPHSGAALNADHRLLWCHDLNYGPLEPGIFSVYDKVLGVSDWHAKALRSYYDLPEQQAGFVPNGIDLSYFADSQRKVPFRCVYASSPDRGLLQLLHLWPQIIGGESGAELHIAYGFDTIDKMIELGRTDLIPFKEAVEKKVADTPQVVWRGRLPQDELAKLYEESWLWLYPTSFLEVSCISAMEAMAGGAVPVTSASGALRETIGTAGVVVTGMPHSFKWQDFYVQCAKATLKDVNIRKPLEYAARLRSKSLTWDASYEAWKGIVMPMLDGQKVLVEA
jgi:glycosyltransferase involved in cell wall biosynthesis